MCTFVSLHGSVLFVQCVYGCCTSVCVCVRLNDINVVVHGVCMN